MDFFYSKVTVAIIFLTVWHQGMIGVKMMWNCFLLLSLDWVNSKLFIRKKCSEWTLSFRISIEIKKVQKHLSCDSSASSSPVPEITWKRANGVPFPSKVKMKYSNAVLEIPSFQQDDTGGYECVAENKMGKNTATGRLAFYGTVVWMAMKTQKMLLNSTFFRITFYPSCI